MSAGEKIICAKEKKMRRINRILLLAVAVVFIAGCASKQPVLYPNEHLNQVGDSRATEDINECMRMAEQSGAKDDKTKEIAKDTAGAGAVGGAAGAASGAVLGRTGKGAGAGAAGAAAGALVHGVLKSDDPGVIYRRFVERCLSEKGYDVIGWR